MPVIDGISYGQRKAITISHANVISTLSNFPLCVRINGDADLGGVCRSDGADLRFTDSAGNLLYAEKESFSIAAGPATGLFWVRVPSIAAGADSTLYCYYGNQQAQPQTGATNVWDSNFHGVWHLNETASPFHDSTGYGNHNTNTANFPTPVTGLLGKAQLFSRAAGSYLIMGTSSSLDATTRFSLSAWLMLSTIPSAGQYYEIITKRLGDANYGFRINPWGYGEAYYCTADSVWRECITAGPAVPDTGAWSYVCGVYDGDFVRFYVNGVQAAFLGADAPPAVQAAPLTLGAWSTGTVVDHGYCMDGALDEARFSTIARSGDWIKFEYYNQKDLTGQLTWGPPQTCATGVRPLLDGSLASGTPLLEALS